MKPAKSIILPATGTLLVAIAAQSNAASVSWDGGGGDGLWDTATNWSGDVLPANGDDVTINGASVASTEFNTGFNLTLSGNATLTDPVTSFAGGVWRGGGANVTVEAGSTFGGGGFYDLQNVTLNFVDGSLLNVGDWEQKDTNVFNFELSSSGFTKLNAGTFRIGNGGLTADIANATYNVDMASYTGGTGVIELVDFSGDSAPGGMDNATFTNVTTGANLNVLNAGSYVANIQWNDTTEAIELNITAVPEPGSLALISLGGLLIVRRRRG